MSPLFTTGWFSCVVSVEINYATRKIFTDQYTRQEEEVIMSLGNSLFPGVNGPEPISSLVCFWI